MSEKREHVLCIERKALPNLTDGTSPLSNLWDKLGKNELFTYRRRTICEKDPSWLQIIPYVVTCRFAPNAQASPQVLAYYRQPHATEERLKGKRSIGIGGHINMHDSGDVKSLDEAESFEDVMPLKQTFASSVKAIIKTAAFREVQEELCSGAYGWLRDTGYFYSLLYDGSDEVGTVHLGVVIFMMAMHDDFRTGPELHSPAWVSIADLDVDDTFENWSRQVILAAFKDGEPVFPINPTMALKLWRETESHRQQYEKQLSHQTFKQGHLGAALRRAVGAKEGDHLIADNDRFVVDRGYIRREPSIAVDDITRDRGLSY